METFFYKAKRDAVRAKHKLVKETGKRHSVVYTKKQIDKDGVDYVFGYMVQLG